MAPKKGSHPSPNTEFKKGMVPWNKRIPMAPEAKEKMVAKLRGRSTWNKGTPMNEWMPEESNELRKAKISQNNARYWAGKNRPDLLGNPSEKVIRHLERLHQNPELEERRLKASIQARKTPEVKAKQAKATALSWKDPQVRERRIKGVLKALNRRPTRLEARLIDILERNKLPYHYTGDGSLIIAGINPDFANCNGAKKVIEIFGIVFHDPDKTFLPQIPLTQQEEYRKAIYASFGFDCLILWDVELNKLSDEEVTQRINTFTKARRKPSPQLELKGVG